MNDYEVKKSEAQTPERLDASAGKVYAPRVDIHERETETILMADLPGVGEAELNVELEKNTLTIRGKVAAEAPKGSPVFGEFDAATYERAFTISNEVDREHISAVMKDGVLTLTLPKITPEPARRIQIKAG